MKKILLVCLTAVLLSGGISLFAQNSPANDDSGRLIRVVKNEKYGFIDKTGTLVIPCTFDYVDAFSEGMALFAKGDPYNHLFGYMDRKGKVVIPCILEDLGANMAGLFRPTKFSEGLAQVFGSEDDSIGNGFIDNTGRLVLALHDEEMIISSSFSEGLAIYGVINESNEGPLYHRGFIDKTGRVVIRATFEYANDFSEGLARVSKDGMEGFIDKTGKIVIPLVYDRSSWLAGFSEGLAAVIKDEQYGYVNHEGKLVIPHNYDEATPFSEGLAAVKKNDLWGFIDKTGKVVIPFQFKDAKAFSEGLALVNKDRKYGFIDKTGKVIIPCIYNYAEAFSDGVAVVIKDEKYGLIDKSGKLIAFGKYDAIGDLAGGEFEEYSI